MPYGRCIMVTTASLYACRVGALRVGDQLLGINGKSIQGSTVSYAIQLLKSADSLVKLKIYRENTGTLQYGERAYIFL